MKYISWAAFYEGPSDALYLDVLLPRLVRDLVAREGAVLVEVPDTPAVRLGSRGRSINTVAEEACRFQQAFHVVFIHADSGGRGLEGSLPARSDAYCAAMFERCNWRSDRCITVTPRHETEAWLISDGLAVTTALGYSGDPSEAGLPDGAQEAEGVVNPKHVLNAAVESITGRRRRQAIANLYPAIAQRQRFDLLRGSASFLAFEDRLRICLRTLGCLNYP